MDGGSGDGIFFILEPFFDGGFFGVEDVGCHERRGGDIVGVAVVSDAHINSIVVVAIIDMSIQRG